ncbi:MAG: hypothetical protein Kow0058_02630 [Roseovarius sp.]
MRDDWMGGLLAFAVAAPVMVVCCGGGGIAVAAILGGIGGWLSGWLSGLGGVATMVAAGGGLLVWGEIRRRRAGRRAGQHEGAQCCAPTSRKAGLPKAELKAK